MGYNFQTVHPLSLEEQRELGRLKEHALSIPYPFSSQDEAAEEEYFSAWKAVERANKADYRINSVGLGFIVDRMAAFGMLWELSEPEFPSLESFGLKRYPDDEGSQLTEMERGFLSECSRVFRYDHGAGPIPWYKIGDDPWVISPREVGEALRVYDSTLGKVRFGSSDQDACWGDFVEFLRGVPRRGGMTLV